VPADVFALPTKALHYARRKTGECPEDFSARSQISQSIDHAGDPRLYPCGGDARTIPHDLSAGQLGMTPDGKFAGGPGDFHAQAAQAFENLKLGLAAAGASFDHVVKVTVYFTDMANLQSYFEVRDRYVNTEAPPASTAVQISKLARDGALFEIEAIAVVPEG
jgi:enamine deaminase RidA (YjgF/YER057c/UK114 family)